MLACMFIQYNNPVDPSGLKPCSDRRILLFAMDQEQSMTIFNYYVGAIAVGGGLITAAVFCCSLLPRTCMKVFQRTLQETGTLLQQIKDEALVPVLAIYEFETKLRILKESSANLRDSTHQCSSLLREVIAAYRGLSTAIQRSTNHAIDLQARIAEQRRARRLSNSLMCGQPSALSTSSLNSEICANGPGLPDSDTQQSTDVARCFSSGTEKIQVLSLLGEMTFFQDLDPSTKMACPR
ncbi:hypothetical protein H2248_011366 [Termitomyces sp. 'cryptogamus']|nr:hypothetical protein H2248_011366 [Termitomyces sp. 'cryptogamus']